MPTLVKFVTIFASNEGQGWQEVHFRNVDEGQPQLGNQMEYYRTNIAPLRAVLLGEDCSIVGYRVSYPRVDDVASFGIRDKKVGTEGRAGAAAQLSLAVVFKDATYSKSKITHLRGFWDTLEQNETYQPLLPVNAGWESALIAWKQALINGQFGWPAKDPARSAKGIVNDYTIGVDGRVNFALTVKRGVLPDQNIMYPVQFARINNSNSPLNRTILCTTAPGGTITTVKPIAAGPFKSDGTFIYRGTSFIRYVNTASISVGRRRMGKPLNRAPGRSKAKPLY